ncbi:protein AF1q [Ictalurus punctatus]|uniref:Protein AF1q n=1 Tax=Ictalurus punctatus TaxID=7998 RepID=A0A2D0PWI6_ICTPU|nr:protein AF1q [Ictalurus punctatus]XP_017310382.2 protein AF1q [Ictalurus punctatus]
MLDMTSTQFDSFLFWRQPIAALDLSELEDLGLAEPKSKDGSLSGKTGKSSPKLDGDDDMELSEFSSFNYWKEPIASIDMLDFSLLLL